MQKTSFGFICTDTLNNFNVYTLFHIQTTVWARKNSAFVFTPIIRAATFASLFSTLSFHLKKDQLLLNPQNT
ncbi:hypothetical protein CW304_15555 [Bacillus sp. UFRGS-B20]|nr:hypothetical protein CW304_15555 [Bacillus sp. UFRGS-B20]